MADLSSASSQTLRRSERRGKYHFDVASMFGNKAAHCDEVSDQSLHPKKKSKKPANSAIQKFSTTEAGESHNANHACSSNNSTTNENSVEKDNSELLHILDPQNSFTKTKKRKFSQQPVSNLPPSLNREYQGTQQSEPKRSKGEYGDFMCQKCPAKFESRLGLSNHLKLHGVNKKEFPCEICDFSCTNKKTMRQHKRIHGLVNSKRRKKIKDNSGGQGFSNTGTQLFAEKNLIHSLNESSATQLKDTASGKTRARNRFQSSAISKTFDKEKMTPTIRESKPRLGRKAKRGISMSKKSRRFRKALNRCMMKKYKIMCSEIGCGFKFASQLSLIAHRFHHHRRIYFRSANMNVFSEIYLRLCLKCGKIFHSGRASLRLHQAHHHPGNRFLLKLLPPPSSSTFDLSTTDMDKTKHCISDIEENTVIPPKTEKLSDNDGLSENPPSQNSLPENLFYCTHCPYATEQIVKLQRHELKHTNKADNQCKVCTFSCRTIEILNQHMRLHSPEKQQVPSFQRDLLRPVHLQMDEQCQINSVPEESTKRHSETTLSAERRSDIFVCPHCPYKSKHGCDMKAHLKMHNEKNAHQCGQCSYSTKRLNALKSHEKLHDGVDQQLVNQAASNNVNMSNQKSRCLKLIKKDDKILGEKLEKINNEAIYLCHYCPQELKTCADLFIHSRHHFVNSSTKFNCNKCEFKTNLETIFSNHEKVHENDFSSAHDDRFVFKCPECPAELNSYGKLWHHIQKHKKTSRFSCKHCTFSTGSIQCLHEHVSLHGTKRISFEKFVTTSITASSSDKSTRCAPLITSSEKDPSASFDVYSDLNSVEASSTNKLLDRFENLFNKTINSIPNELLKLDKTENETLPIPIHRCSECPFETTDIAFLKLHLKMHSGSTRPYKCTFCSFNCLSANALHLHLGLHIKEKEGRPILKPSSLGVETGVYMNRKEHIKLLQRRLITTIKRSTFNDSSNKYIFKRVVRRTDKYNCSKCCFRCDSLQAFSGHMEFHGRNDSAFNCLLCDYGSNTKNIVIFHEQNHHLSMPLTDQILNNKILI